MDRVQCIALLVSLAVLSTSVSVLVQGHVIDESDEPRVMFVVSGSSGQIEGETLTLDGVSSAVYFSDRPARVAGHMSVADFVEESVLPPTERDGLAFLGSYSHPPNRQAVEFFCGQVMPLIRQLRPDTTCVALAPNPRPVEQLSTHPTYLAAVTAQMSSATPVHRCDGALAQSCANGFDWVAVDGICATQ